MRGALLFAFALVCVPARAAPPTSYAFTDAACVTGKAFGAIGQTCKLLTGAPTRAGFAMPAFVTALAGGVPTALSTSVQTTVKLSFALSCINPASHAGKQAMYAGVTMAPCTPNGGVPASWPLPVNMLFPKNKPSATVAPSFSYDDVGKVQLFLRDAANQIVAAPPFVVKPDKLAIISVTRSAGGPVIPLPQSLAAAGNGFVKVDEAFTIEVAALTKNGVPAPNFGSEGVRVALDSKAAIVAMITQPKLIGSFAKVVAGVFSGNAFAVDEVGILAITPRLVDINQNDDYLGAGAAGANVTANVGRFYPDHFDTIVTPGLPCLTRMNCPGGVTVTYAGQPFTVTVQPKNAAGGNLQNYYGSVLARDITLTAFSLAGGTTQDPSAGALSGNVIKAASMKQNKPISATPIYSLPQPFINTAPNAFNWTAPTTLYIRANAVESTDGTLISSSLRGGASVEGGMMIVSGRLALDKPYGSELLKMPIRAEAQYWSAFGRWETSASDNVSSLQSGGIVFSNCLKKLGPPCNLALLRVTANTLTPLKNGVATFWLQPTGVGNIGSAEFQLSNPAWLPSSIGRAVFGLSIYKSPFIYLREVY
jgi:hypothetical protein